MSHKAGFVSLVGKPNAGKSTLMNALVGEKMSIVTSKAQTTRHRILGIVNEPDVQIIFSDTPGVIKPHYGLQESMMSVVNGSVVDADLILFVTDINERYDENDVLERLQKTKSPVAVIINKIDKKDSRANAVLDEVFDLFGCNLSQKTKQKSSIGLESLLKKSH